MAYKIVKLNVIDHDDFGRIFEITTTPKRTFWGKIMPMDHKVYFDVYNINVEGWWKKYSCTIHDDWIKIWHKYRNKVKKMLYEYFWKYTLIGNFSNTIKKL